jgi:hypothetical protein
MKHAYTFAGICVIATLTACAGTGGGTSSTTTMTGVSTNTVRIETQIPASSTIPPIDQIGPSSCPLTFSLVDPTNIESGDTFQFVLASYDANGNRSVITAATGFSTSDSAGLYGGLTYDEGIFSASTAQTQTAQTINVTYNGQTYYAQYDVLPHQARVRGRLLSHATGDPIPNVEIDFYGPPSLAAVQQAAANGTLVTLVLRGKVVTQADGTFQASVPARISSLDFDPTEYMQINNATLPTGYQRFFSYDGLVYATGTVSAAAAAPIESPITGLPFGDNAADTTGLVVGNDDLLSVVQCSGSAPVTEGDLQLYATSEATPALKHASKSLIR